MGSLQGCRGTLNLRMMMVLKPPTGGKPPWRRLASARLEPWGHEQRSVQRTVCVCVCVLVLESVF